MRVQKKNYLAAGRIGLSSRPQLGRLRVTPVHAAAEHDQPLGAPMTRQSSQALPKDKPDMLQTAEGSMPVPAERDMAEPAPTCSLDGNDSSASGWGRKRPRGFRP